MNWEFLDNMHRFALKDNFKYILKLLNKLIYIFLHLEDSVFSAELLCYNWHFR